jgi:uncharacterized SAM-binding protein YcdF (DUF218 family)
VFVLLSKILDLALSPLVWALLALVPVLFWARRSGRIFGFTLLAFGTLYLSSTPFLSSRIVRRMERSAPRTFHKNTVYDVVIVLGGGVDAPTSAKTRQLELNAAGDRVVMGYALFKSGQAKNILISGGAVFPAPGLPAEANIVRETLIDWGVPAENVIAEPSSRNTRENAVESLRIVREKNWTRVLLVTSAAHMPRAAGCFQALGLSPDTLPVDHSGVETPFGQFLPRAYALSAVTDSLREMAGRVVYRVAGWSR